MITTVYPDRHSWLAGRGQFVTASDVGAIMGLNAYRTRESVLREKKTGERDDLSDNYKVQFGVKMEWFAAHWYAVMAEGKTGGKLVDPGPYTVQECPEGKLRCTVDRFLLAPEDEGMANMFRTSCEISVPEKTIIVEVKTGTAKMWKDGVPPYYYAQAQAQMFVTGVRETNFAVLIVTDAQRKKVWDLDVRDIRNLAERCHMVVFDIKYDELFIVDMVEAINEFYRDWK